MSNGVWRERAEKQLSWTLKVLTTLTDNPDAVIDSLQKQAELQSTLEHQRREIENLKDLNKQQAEYLRAFNNGRNPIDDICEALRRPLKSSPRPAATIPPEQWRRLIQLTHPDRHDGSVASQEVTRWLLENRPK
jgi:hypothetical protein